MEIKTDELLSTHFKLFASDLLRSLLTFIFVENIIIFKHFIFLLCYIAM